MLQVWMEIPTILNQRKFSSIGTKYLYSSHHETIKFSIKKRNLLYLNYFCQIQF